jgi:chromosome segregation ATPase
MGIVNKCLANMVNDLKKELKSAKAHIVILQATNDDLVKEVNHQRSRYQKQCRRYETLDKEYEELKQQLSEK